MERHALARPHCQRRAIGRRRALQRLAVTALLADDRQPEPERILNLRTLLFGKAGGVGQQVLKAFGDRSQNLDQVFTAFFRCRVNSSQGHAQNLRRCGLLEILLEQIGVEPERRCLEILPAAVADEPEVYRLVLFEQFAADQQVGMSLFEPLARGIYGLYARFPADTRKPQHPAGLDPLDPVTVQKRAPDGPRISVIGIISIDRRDQDREPVGRLRRLRERPVIRNGFAQRAESFGSRTERCRSARNRKMPPSQPVSGKRRVLPR